MNLNYTELAPLASLVVQWAADRNLIHGATAKDQTLKTVSEFAELQGAIAMGDVDGVIDGVGDTMVTQIIVCAQMGLNYCDVIGSQPQYGYVPEFNIAMMNCCLGKMADNVLKGQEQQFFENLCEFTHRLGHLAGPLSLEECLRAAYDEIKDRKGVVYHGVFIKDSDPRYAGAVAELASAKSQMAVEGEFTAIGGARVTIEAQRVEIGSASVKVTGQGLA